MTGLVLETAGGLIQIKQVPIDIQVGFTLGRDQQSGDIELNVGIRAAHIGGKPVSDLVLVHVGIFARLLALCNARRQHGRGIRSGGFPFT